VKLEFKIGDGDWNHIQKLYRHTSAAVATEYISYCISAISVKSAAGKGKLALKLQFYISYEAEVMWACGVECFT
jgi:hypothetical protein